MKLGFRRMAPLFVVLALVAAACGEDTGEAEQISQDFFRMLAQQRRSPPHGEAAADLRG